MFVVISKCETCGSPIFSKSFDLNAKAFTDTKVTRSCTCHETTWKCEPGDLTLGEIKAITGEEVS